MSQHDAKGLQHLYRRIEKATRPDRELDAALAAHFAYVHVSGPLTSSLDAAVALAESLLPTWSWTVGRTGTRPEERFAAHLEAPRGTTVQGTSGWIEPGPTPALALMRALLLVLIADAEVKAAEEPRK